MGQLFFLIGLPRSGKSSIATEWVNGKIDIGENSCFTYRDIRYKPLTIPRVIVCADDIRLSMGHRWNGYVEPFVNAIKLTMISTLLKKHDVLVDGTHTTTKSISGLLDIYKIALPLIIQTPPDICKQRALQTKQDDLIPIINRMYDQLLKMSNEDFISPKNIVNTINELRSKVSEPRIAD